MSNIWSPDDDFSEERVLKLAKDREHLAVYRPEAFGTLYLDDDYDDDEDGDMFDDWPGYD